MLNLRPSPLWDLVPHPHPSTGRLGEKPAACRPKTDRAGERREGESRTLAGRAAGRRGGEERRASGEQSRSQEGGRKMLSFGAAQLRSLCSWVTRPPLSASEP